MRALLLKGASRDARNNKNETCEQMIKENVMPQIANELRQMLKKPKFVECCMFKTPLVVLRQNHKT